MDVINPNEVYWDSFTSECLLPEFRGNLATIIGFRQETDIIINETYFREQKNRWDLTDVFFMMLEDGNNGFVYNGINGRALGIILEASHKKRYLELGLTEARKRIETELAERLFGWKFEEKPKLN